MSKLRLNMMMSLDGFAAGPEQSEENPFGIGGMQLNEWLFPLEAFRQMQGETGGEVNASTPIVEGWFENIGATVMGRNMFGGGPGPWGEDPWNGFWGEDPPYHHPVFILTHHARDPVEMQGGTTFHFGAGTRPFDDVGTVPRRPEQVEVVEAPGVTHLRYRFA
jgi:dihydrofolate reductase